MMKELRLRKRYRTPAASVAVSDQEGIRIMRNSMLVRSVAAISSLAMLAALAACGDNTSSNNASSNTNSSDTTTEQVSGTFNGEGATSQESAVQAWISGYTQNNSGATVNYNGTGSGAGVKKFLTGAIQWAGSDAPLKDEEVEKSKAVCANDTTAFEVPVYISAIAIVYNINGVDKSKHIELDAATIAKIFDGKIKYWDDAAITGQGDNKSLNLPHKEITVVHRSDESGTTQDFTSYLQDAGGKDAWPYDPAKAWPNKVGMGANGTSVVATTVQQGDGTIGYIDASKAADFGTVAVKVGDAYVPYSAEATSKVVDASPFDDSAKAPRVVVKLDHQTTEAGAYPVALVSYMVVCPEYKKADDAKFVKSWLTYVTSEEGQQTAAENAGSAPMSDTLRSKVTTSIEAIKTK